MGGGAVGPVTDPVVADGTAGVLGLPADGGPVVADPAVLALEGVPYDRRPAKLEIRGL